jgi:hypothetical protein
MRNSNHTPDHIHVHVRRCSVKEVMLFRSAGPGDRAFPHAAAGDVVIPRRSIDIRVLMLPG